MIPVPIYSTRFAEKVRKGQCLARLWEPREYDLAMVVNEKMELWKPFGADEFHFGIVASAETRKEIRHLVNHEFRRAFAANIFELGSTNLVKVRIEEVPGSHPVAQKPYRSSRSHEAEMDRIIGEWVEAGIVVESDSSYTSPAILVDKKDGSKRPVFDFRCLNDQTVTFPYPMPSIDDHMVALSDAKYYTVIDLANGYLQLEIDEKSRHKTAFVTPTFKGEFVRLPYGLKNAPAWFQQLMNRVLGKMKNYQLLLLLRRHIVVCKNAG